MSREVTLKPEGGVKGLYCCRLGSISFEYRLLEIFFRFTNTPRKNVFQSAYVGVDLPDLLPLFQINDAVG